MKNNKVKKDNIKLSYNKLTIYNTLIALVLVIILYFALPKILNYPTNTIDNDFQIQVVGIKYTAQFITLASLIVGFVFVFIRLVYRRLYKGALSSNKETVLKTRKKCFNMQYIMLTVEIILPTVLSIILLLVFHTTFDLLIRLCTIIFSFTALFATTSYMISRNFFRNLLIQTSDISKNSIDTTKVGTPIKLLILTLPLFLCSFVLILLISTTTMTIEKGDLLYKFYKQELTTNLDSNSLSLEDIKESFKNFDYKSENDFGIIMDGTTGEIIYKSKNKEISDSKFLATYTLSFYTEENGQCFEYYGQNTQASMHKVTVRK